MVFINILNDFVFRDLKPQNVFLTKKDVVKIGKNECLFVMLQLKYWDILCG